MNPIDKKLDRALRILRANGGIVGMDPNAPEWTKHAFLEALMDCPECRAMIEEPEGHC